MSAFAVDDPPTSSSSSSSEEAVVDLGLMPEPEFDHIDLSFNDLNDEQQGGRYPDKKGLKRDIAGNDEDEVYYSQYILGTLVVRVVAARDLQPVVKGGLGSIFFRGSVRGRDRGSIRGRNLNTDSSNPYTRLFFAGQTQRTSAVYDTLDPVWPRGETMYFDVSLPLENAAHEDANAPKKEKGGITRTPRPLRPPQPILRVAIFHANASAAAEGKQPKKGYTGPKGDEPLLGMASIDMRQLLTGKTASFDEWVPLTGTDDATGTIRIVCEYEPTDPSPRPGDIVRFTGFCNPADLYPVPPSRTFRVDDVDGDQVVLSYTSPEGWPCTFAVHRFMLLCAVRHQAAIEKYQDHLYTLAERLACSPMVHVVSETVDRVPDDGLVFVGVDAVVGGAALLRRWWTGGLGTAFGDVIYATNLDGQHSPDDADWEGMNGSGVPEEVGIMDENIESTVKATTEPLPGMPCCPITGEPMRDPVVAADGHTYERSAITKWLRSSDKSPLTGAFLPHKEVVPNYMLISSLRDDGNGMITTL